MPNYTLQGENKIMLEIIMILLSVLLLVLNVFSIRANIWYREEIKRMDESRKQYEKLSKECEAELAEKLSEEKN